MGKRTSRQDTDFAGYCLSEDAQLRLLQVRDRLCLLSALTMPAQHRDDNVDALRLQPSALAHCFQQLADELGSVLDDAQWLE